MEEAQETSASAVRRKPLPGSAETLDRGSNTSNRPTESLSSARHQQNTSTHDPSLALSADDLRCLLDNRDSLEQDRVVKKPSPTRPILTPSSATESISATSGLSDQSTEIPTATTNARSKDETANGHDDRISERIHDEPKSWGTTLLAWWQELLLCFASIALVVTLAGVLLHFDNQGLPQWPLGLTLNTVVALLSTLARAAFLIPVAESISQLKWLWYRKERSLNDFQDFDKASRGAWGAIQLVKTTKGWSPGIISMVLLLTSILTSTLTQSTVTYPTRLTLLSAKPALSRAVKVPDRTPHAGDMWLHMNPLFDNGVYSGLHHSYGQEFPFEQPRCPTTECRWNDFSSLGLCVKTTNITDSFNVTYKEGRASGKGPLANLTQAHLKITQVPFDKPRKRSVYLVNKSNLTYFLGNQTANKIGAMEILFYYCVQRFKVSVENNIASRTIVSTSADREDDGYEYIDGTRFKVDALKIPDEPGAFFPLSPIMTVVLNVSLTASFNNTYYETWEREYGHIRGLASTRYFNVLNLVRNEDAALGEDLLGDAIRNITDNVARGVTATFFDSSTNVTGEAYVTETYVFVRWGWLAFISAQILLSILLVGVAIIQTRQAGLGVAKSSILPAFFAINSQDKHALEQGGTRSNQQKEMESMIQNKSGAGWRLGLAERGWILRS